MTSFDPDDFFRPIKSKFEWKFKQCERREVRRERKGVRHRGRDPIFQTLICGSIFIDVLEHLLPFWHLLVPFHGSFNLKERKEQAKGN